MRGDRRATCLLSDAAEMRVIDTELADGLAEGLAEGLRKAAHRVRYNASGVDPGRGSAAAVRRHVQAQNEIDDF